MALIDDSLRWDAQLFLHLSWISHLGDVGGFAAIFLSFSHFLLLIISSLFKMGRFSP